jgi:hypothetical protein
LVDLLYKMLLHLAAGPNGAVSDGTVQDNGPMVVVKEENDYV